MYSLAAVILLGVSLHLADADLRPYKTTAQNLFHIFDVNKDTEFSLAELKLSFDSFDSNFDGVVSLTEYTTFLTNHNQYLFVLTRPLHDIYDRDRDGLLTEYDFNQLYKQWDANENNIVSELEFVHWWSVTLEALDNPDS